MGGRGLPKSPAEKSRHALGHSFVRGSIHSSLQTIQSWPGNPGTELFETFELKANLRSSTYSSPLRKILHSRLTKDTWYNLESLRVGDTPWASIL